MTTSMTLFCQLLALGRAPNKDRDRSIRSQLNSRCQLVSFLSLFIAIYIAKTKALLPTVWPVPNVSYNTVNLTTALPLFAKQALPECRLYRQKNAPFPYPYLPLFAPICSYLLPPFAIAASCLAMRLPL